MSVAAPAIMLFARHWLSGNALGGVSRSFCRSFRPKPSIGAVKLSLRVARFFVPPDSTVRSATFELAALDVEYDADIPTAPGMGIAVLGRCGTSGPRIPKSSTRLVDAELGGASLCGVARSAASSAAACPNVGEPGSVGNGGTTLELGRDQDDDDPTGVAPAVDGRFGSRASADDARPMLVIPLLPFGVSSGVDFLCSGWTSLGCTGDDGTDIAAASGGEIGRAHV